MSTACSIPELSRYETVHAVTTGGYREDTRFTFCSVIKLSSRELTSELRRRINAREDRGLGLSGGAQPGRPRRSQALLPPRRPGPGALGNSCFRRSRRP